LKPITIDPLTVESNLSQNSRAHTFCIMPLVACMIPRQLSFPPCSA
jgi:hypothetical protein